MAARLVSKRLLRASQRTSTRIYARGFSTEEELRQQVRVLEAKTAKLEEQNASIVLLEERIKELEKQQREAKVSMYQGIPYPFQRQVPVPEANPVDWPEAPKGPPEFPKDYKATLMSRATDVVDRGTGSFLYAAAKTSRALRDKLNSS